MSLKQRPVTLSFVYLAVLVGAGQHRPSQASNIPAPWSGATAEVQLFGRTQSEQGPTARESASGSETAHYWGSPNAPQMLSADHSGSVTAFAGGDPAHLLNVTGSAQSPYPGTIGGPNFAGGGSATASWTDDVAVVTPQAGSSMPDAIRLNFALTFSAPNDLPYSRLVATYNDTNLSYMAAGYYPFIHPDPSNNLLVDSSSLVVGSGSFSTLKDTFHVDLHLDQLGRSDPFSLSLYLAPPIGLFSNQRVSVTDMMGNLALIGVTLPDGTSLASIGASVSFDSGLPWANPVPEPASVLAWGTASAVAAAMAIRRSRPAHRGR